MFIREIRGEVFICEDQRKSAANLNYCTVKTSVFVAVAPPLALAAETVTENVPVGVPGLCWTGVLLLLPPHPATAANARQAIAPANLNLAFFDLNWLSVSAANPKNASKATGGIRGADGGTNVVDFAVVEMLSVTCEVVVTEGGLKLHAVPAGNPLQEKVIAPSPELLFVTFITTEAVPPAVTAALGLCSASASAGTTCVGSLAELFAVFDSVPPETVAVFVTLEGTFGPTFKVRVIGSKLVPAVNTSPREHSSGESVQFQFVPEMEVAKRPEGSLSSTVTSAEVSPVPTLETVMV